MYVLVDIDGTLAIRNGRDPFDWEKLSSDLPNQPVIAVVRGLSLLGYEIVFVSGRHEKLRRQTADWISSNVAVKGRIILRSNSDFRSDEIVKEELIRENFTDLDSIFLVIDDRQRVVDMWRERLKLTCLQVSPGNF
jgi:hypothetical protein